MQEYHGSLRTTILCRQLTSGGSSPEMETENRCCFRYDSLRSARLPHRVQWICFSSWLRVKKKYSNVLNFTGLTASSLGCISTIMLLAVGRWFPPGTPVSSTRKLISSSSFHRLDMTLAVAEALNPNTPNLQSCNSV